MSLAHRLRTLRLAGGDADCLAVFGRANFPQNFPAILYGSAAQALFHFALFFHFSSPSSASMLSRHLHAFIAAGAACPFRQEAPMRPMARYAERRLRLAALHERRAPPRITATRAFTFFIFTFRRAPSDASTARHFASALYSRRAAMGDVAHATLRHERRSSPRHEEAMMGRLLHESPRADEAGAFASRHGVPPLSLPAFMHACCSHAGTLLTPTRAARGSAGFHRRRRRTGQPMPLYARRFAVFKITATSATGASARYAAESCRDIFIGHHFHGFAHISRREQTRARNFHAAMRAAPCLKLHTPVNVPPPLPPLASFGHRFYARRYRAAHISRAIVVISGRRFFAMAAIPRQRLER